jgi:hypothetical protein
MRFIVYGVLGVAMLAIPGVAAAKCTDDAAVTLARAAADAACDCSGSDNHGDYVSCVNDVAKERVAAGTLPANCKGEVTKCAAKSTCGKPDAVTCCKVDKKGKVKCSIKKNADRCQSSSKTIACVGTAASCCDACDGACGGVTTTSSTAPTPTTAPVTTSSTTTVPTTSSTSTTLGGSPSSAFVGS